VFDDYDGVAAFDEVAKGFDEHLYVNAWAPFRRLRTSRSARRPC
jgi:hypothetical protein